jgi:molecular chaperone DnaK (HSP70)
VERTIGIDFGTTNTRIAYCDGAQVRVLTERNEFSPFIPSAVSYQYGRPFAFGRRAKEDESSVSISSLKWLLAEDREIDVGAATAKTATEIVTDFAEYLRTILQDNHVDPQGHDIAVTIPVKFPLFARRRLVDAFCSAGLPIKGIYPEPVAALFATLATENREGYSAIFDWGGGTLDIASLHTKSNKAHVLGTEGIREGGDDFDEWIAREALEDFLGKNPEVAEHREDVWQTKRRGLLVKAEKVKWDCDSHPSFRWDFFVGNRDLEYRLNVPLFEDRLARSVDRAIRLFRRAITNSGGAERLVRPIILSGGTRNLSFLRRRLEAEFGDRIIDELPQRKFFKDLDANRIDSATAIGASLLMANQSKPVFSKSIGVRLADARHSSSSDLFGKVFNKGEQIDSNRIVSMDLHVTNPSSGVANLLVCEQLDEDVEPAGTLLRILSIPVHDTETRITAKLSVTEDLLLKVKVVGAIATVKPEESEFYIPLYGLGFFLPGVD